MIVGLLSTESNCELFGEIVFITLITDSTQNKSTCKFSAKRKQKLFPLLQRPVSYCIVITFDTECSVGIQNHDRLWFIN